jgi:hypothetical protein
MLDALATGLIVAALAAAVAALAYLAFRRPVDRALLGGLVLVEPLPPMRLAIRPRRGPPIRRPSGV